MTVEYPLWLPVLAVLLIAGLLVAVIAYAIAHHRDGHRIARWALVAGRLRRRGATLSVADQALADQLGHTRGDRRA